MDRLVIEQNIYLSIALNCYHPIISDHIMSPSASLPMFGYRGIFREKLIRFSINTVSKSVRQVSSSGNKFWRRISTMEDDGNGSSDKSHLGTGTVNSVEGFQEIKEGLASMFYDKNEEVFYNKVQVFNRDTSIQVIKLFGETFDKEKKAKYDKKMERFAVDPSKFDHKPMEPTYGIHVLDALAATGLRSVRYVKEIPVVNKVTINDLLPAATAAAQVTCDRNGVDPQKIEISTGDAVMLMYGHKDANSRYDVIDLDPYGTACPFLDSAVQAVADGGLLCVTCTDMPVLSGNYPETCFAKYGSMPLKAKYLHEMSLRILLHAIDSAANKYSRHIVPWVSLSVDFYVRVFVRVFESPAEVKKSCLRRIMVHQSTQCPSFFVQPLGYVKVGNKGGDSYTASVVTAPSVCPETGGRMKVGGPFWGGPLHDRVVVDSIIERVEAGVADPSSILVPVSTSSRIIGRLLALISRAELIIPTRYSVLTCISEELSDSPFYYQLPDLASRVHSKVPTSLEINSAIVNAGYSCSKFHHEAQAIKTNAPDHVIWDIMRAFCKKHPPIKSTDKTLKDAASLILAKESQTVVDFTVPECLKVPKKQATRFAPNPEECWGPKRKAGRLLKEGAEGDKPVKTKSKRGGRKKGAEAEGEGEAENNDSEVHAEDVKGVVIESDSKECNSSGSTGVEVEAAAERVEAGIETGKEQRKRPRIDALESP